VNVDPRESDTRPLAVESLKPGAGALVSVIRDEEDLLLAGKTRPLWPALAAAAALMLALEMLLLAFWRRSSLTQSSVPTPRAGTGAQPLRPEGAERIQPRATPWASDDQNKSRPVGAK
jgi:hypothetical protein